MQVESYCSAKSILRLQELVKYYGLRWMYNPYPINPNKADSDWRVGIDYSETSEERAREFDLAWIQLKTPIVEKNRKYTLIHKIKVCIKGIFKINIY